MDSTKTEGGTKSKTAPSDPVKNVSSSKPSAISSSHPTRSDKYPSTTSHAYSGGHSAISRSSINAGSNRVGAPVPTSSAAPMKSAPSSSRPSKSNGPNPQPTTNTAPNENSAVVEVGLSQKSPYTPTTPAERYTFLSVSKRHESGREGWDIVATEQKWGPERTQLFQAAVDLLEKSRLARLALMDLDSLSGHSPHQAALQRLHRSRVTEKFRALLANIGWCKDLVPWLNAAILDNLARELLEEYIDILRVLRLTCGIIMEARGMLDGRGSRRLHGSTALKSTIAKPPVRSPKPAIEPLPRDPVLILAPGEHSWNTPNTACGAWKERISLLGKVITCPESASAAKDIHTLASNLLKKVQEVKQKWPTRPIVIIGLSVGAKVAIMVSFKAKEKNNLKIDCLICLGLQLQGMAGNTADAVDTRDLFQLRSPTLFAIGSQSRLCPVPLMEQVRLKMLARNKLVIVRDADEALRIPLSKRLKVKLTQTMSDDLVLVHIAGFIKDALTHTTKLEDAINIRVESSSGQKRGPVVRTTGPISSDTHKKPKLVGSSTAPSLPSGVKLPSSVALPRSGIAYAAYNSTLTKGVSTVAPVPRSGASTANVRAPASSTSSAQDNHKAPKPSKP
eukprot:m.142724 g.142724  ORF g.142724 m.142724 type:complete len:620 (-) comp14886_c0_seq2:129-1988(-)